MTQLLFTVSHGGSTFRIVKKSWGDNGEYREYIVEQRYRDTLGGERWEQCVAIKYADCNGEYRACNVFQSDESSESLARFIAAMIEQEQHLG